MTNAKPLAPKPDHVPSELVVDYDFYALPHPDTDYQINITRRLHAGPDIIWTPRNGGHWVFTRATDIDNAQRDDGLFSIREVTIPAGMTPVRNIPLETDEPEHKEYRGILAPAFEPARIVALEGEIRTLTANLIDGFKDRGHCEFVSEFAAILPIAMFMKMADLPDEDRQMLLEWSDAAVHPRSTEHRIWGYSSMSQYIERLLAERASGAGPDVISLIMRSSVFGRPLTHEEQHSAAMNALLGGLDTVMSTMGFIASFLARHPEHRRQLIEGPALIPRAVDELLRYHGATATARVVTRDTVYNGVTLKKDDRVLVQSMLHGQDPRRFPDPETVDFHRKDIRHATFGGGTHRCLGALLARLEMRIFLEEWLTRIPDFHIAAGEGQIVEGGMVNAVRKLPLAWSKA